MSTTYTERYVAATIKHLPPSSQDDVRAELEASIADAVEGRVDLGDEPAAAERAVLTELGDPAVLAADYADRPLHLIGPRFYLPWRRLLKLLLIIVPICVLVSVALAQVIIGVPIGEVIGSAIGVAASSAIHVCFWTTLVFVVLERTGARTGLPDWDVDQLQETEPTGVGRVDLIASVVLAALLAGGVLWDQFRGFVRVGGEPLPILAPDLWPGWLLALLGLIGLEIVFAVVLHRRGRWDTVLAVVNTGLALLATSWGMTLLVRGDLINPEFVTLAFTANGVGVDVLRILVILLGFGIVGIGAWDVVDGWQKRRRDAR
ncbi:MAG TPA: hypothetical protein IAA98_15895 [Candidatus Avipropionibacterium avicola]|uniref:Uncharacterized protein n=1 Tax=Candidatus Avipropionibacterium avicola TaxID=2840701 RepID=A0A9D1H0Q8_9ACTN|nr:hypothetical protein [Candidatus Avipropionibacterium avicola]